MNDQKSEALTPEDLTRLAKQRAVIEQMLAQEDDRVRYQNASGKLDILQAILEAKLFKSTDTYQLQCMGIVLGDVFVLETSFTWCVVEDEYGRDPCLQYPETTILIFPLTMISKRVERGDEFSIRDLFEAIIADLPRIKAQFGK